MRVQMGWARTIEKLLERGREFTKPLRNVTLP